MRMPRTDLMLIVAVFGCAGLGAMGCEANVPIHDNTADVHDNEVNADIESVQRKVPEMKTAVVNRAGRQRGNAVKSSPAWIVEAAAHRRS